MGSDLWQLGVPAWDLVLRTALIYAALFLALRIFGKREVGQFTLFDLVLVLLVANAVQPAMTGPDSSLVGGLIIIVVLFLLDRGIDLLRFRSHLFRNLLVGHPTIIARDGHWIPEAMKKEHIDQEDVEMMMREHGLDSIDDVKLAMLELDGTISFVPMSAETYHSRRRVRTLRRPE